MNTLFRDLTERHRIFLEESKELDKEEVLAKAEALLKEIREAGTFMLEPEQRIILSSLARHLGEIIFDISEWYPSVRLASAVFAEDKSGLPPELLKRCRATLLNFREFDSDETLRAILVTPELAAYRFGIPLATNKRERIDKTIAYLLQKRASTGQPALSLFLATLRDRQPQGSAIREELEALHPVILQALGPSSLLTFTNRENEDIRSNGQGQTTQIVSFGTQLAQLALDLLGQKPQINLLDSSRLQRKEEVTKAHIAQLEVLLPSLKAKVQLEPREVPPQAFQLPFVNREKEKQLIRKWLERGIDVQLHAPAGYGKSYLLYEMQRELELDGWQSVFLDFADSHRDCIANPQRFLDSFAEQLFTETLPHLSHLDSEQLLKQIGQQVADLDQVVLFLDHADWADMRLLQWIRNTFLETLATDWVPIRVIASAQQIIPSWQGAKEPFNELSLCELNDPVVIQEMIDLVVARYGFKHASRRQARQDEAWQRELATLRGGLLSISRGQPLLMAELLEVAAQEDGFMHATFFSDNWAELCKTCLAPIVGGRILPTVDRGVREAFRSLCIFRYLSPELITALTDSNTPDEGGAWLPFSDGSKTWHVWYSMLCETHLIEKPTTYPLLRISPVIRHIIAQVLQHEDSSLYRARNRRARQEYSRLAKESTLPLAKRAAYLLESLYHATQEDCPKAKAETTFTQPLSDFLSSLPADSTSQEVAQQLAEWLREDSELHDAIDEVAGEGLYVKLKREVIRNPFTSCTIGI